MPFSGVSAQGTDAVTDGPRVRNFSPDGDQIVIGNTNGSATLYDLATEKALRAFSPAAGAVTTAPFAPDGHHLLFVAPSVRRWCGIQQPASVF